MAPLWRAIHASYNLPFIGAWRSLVAHLLWEQGVVGSNPAAPIIFSVTSVSVTAWSMRSASGLPSLDLVESSGDLIEPCQDHVLTLAQFIGAGDGTIGDEVLGYRSGQY